MGSSSSKPSKQKRIYLPAETWTDVLSFIPRNELAQTVSLTNSLFNEISRPRIDEENKRIVPSLLFPDAQIPIAQVPPPINILGFERLGFRFIDHQILEFMRLIKPILGTNVSFRVWDIANIFSQISNIFFGKFPPMLIYQFCNIIKGNVSKMTIPMHCFKLFSMEFLKTVQFVRISDGYEYSEINEPILEWIHSPLDGNKLRYIYTFLSTNSEGINKMAANFEKRFKESIVPVSFVFHFDFDDGNICFWAPAVPAFFSTENHQTGEQLTFDWFIDEGHSYLLICRRKIGDDQGWREIMHKVKNPDENQIKTKLRIIM